MGEIICLLLRNIAVRSPKRIVITAIHTPASRVFMLFTHVTLLTSKGELAFWGRREDVRACLPTRCGVLLVHGVVW